MTKIIIPLHRCTEVEDCPTVRRHPRTLHGCDAAFPGDPEYSAVVERPVSGGYSISWWLALLIVSALGAIAIVFGGPSGLYDFEKAPTEAPVEEQQTA